MCSLSSRVASGDVFSFLHAVPSVFWGEGVRSSVRVRHDNVCAGREGVGGERRICTFFSACSHSRRPSSPVASEGLKITLRACVRSKTCPRVPLCLAACVSCVCIYIYVTPLHWRLLLVYTQVFCLIPMRFRSNSIRLRPHPPFGSRLQTCCRTAYVTLAPRGQLKPRSSGFSH